MVVSMSKTTKQNKQGSFVTLDHFSGGKDASKYLLGPSNVNPESGFISLDRYNYYRGGQNSDYLPIHRLVAVAEYGVEAVAGNVVHHKNGVRFDNRPDNLEVLSNADHSRIESNNTSITERLSDCSSDEIQSILQKTGHSDILESGVKE